MSFILSKKTPKSSSVIAVCRSLVIPMGYEGSSVLSLPPYSCLFSDGPECLTECVSAAEQKTNAYFCSHIVRNFGSTANSYLMQLDEESRAC